MSDAIDNAEVIKYVKRFTSVPEKFVDELFRFYKPETAQDDFVILLDDVANWLEALKRQLRETLTRTYIKGVDYTVEKIPNPRRTPGVTLNGGNNHKRIMLTPDCFKRMCLLTRSRKGEMVRTYFIDVETQFLRYKDELMEGLQAKIATLERELKPGKKLPPGIDSGLGGYIYILRASEVIDELFKVGRTGDLKARMSTYQTGHGEQVQYLYILKVHDVKSAERCIKAQLAEFQHRKRREVYEVPVQLIKEVIKGCNRMDGAKKEYVRRKAVTMTGGAYVMVSRDLVVLP